MKTAFLRLILGTFLALCVLSCDKPGPPPVTDGSYADGVLVLNEGLFEQNNSSITFYDGQTAFQSVFQAENGRSLGDTGNDLVSYQIGLLSYVMVVTNVSSQVEIMDRNSLQLVKQIPLFNGSTARQPRQILIEEDRAFISCFDGTVVVIDLLTNSILETITVGDNPEGMVSLNERIYVVNSGGLNFPIYDSTISVIDPVALTVVDEFQTRMNCAAIFADSENELYVVSRGNYDDIPPALLRIDPVTNEVVQMWEGDFGSFTQSGDDLYYHNAEEQRVQRFDMLTESFIPETIFSTASYDTFYGFSITPDGTEIYAVDAMGYVNSSKIRIYDMSGGFLGEFTAALNATDILFE